MKIVEFERSAEILWDGDVIKGNGRVASGTGSFVIPATFPSLRGEPQGVTTPEELLAAAHATCFGIGLRSVIARFGGSTSRIVVRARIKAQKGAGGIRVIQSFLSGSIYDLAGIDPQDLDECARVAKDECTISNALKGNVDIVCEVISLSEQAPESWPAAT